VQTFGIISGLLGLIQYSCHSLSSSVSTLFPADNPKLDCRCLLESVKKNLYSVAGGTLFPIPQGRRADCQLSLSNQEKFIEYPSGNGLFVRLRCPIAEKCSRTMCTLRFFVFLAPRPRTKILISGRALNSIHPETALMDHVVVSKAIVVVVIVVEKTEKPAITITIMTTTTTTIKLS
jgi:hypothetical protein